MYDILHCNGESIMSLDRVQNRHEAPASLGAKYKPLKYELKGQNSKASIEVPMFVCKRLGQTLD